jgi:hypothetical protein
MYLYLCEGQGMFTVKMTLEVGSPFIMMSSGQSQFVTAIPGACPLSTLLWPPCVPILQMQKGKWPITLVIGQTLDNPN